MESIRSYVVSSFLIYHKLSHSIFANTISDHSSQKTMVAYSFQGKYWFEMSFRCNSVLSEKETHINVHCNTTNDEVTFKRPEEGTKQCIQVC